MSNQFTGQVPRMPVKRWKPVHYCCPGHTPHWNRRLRSGRIRMRMKTALLRDIKETSGRYVETT